MRNPAAGYSLIEVLAAMALLAIALLAGAYTQQAQTSFRAASTAQLQGKKQINDVMTLLADNPERFIYMEDSSGNPVVYVGCFNNYGQQMPTAASAPVVTSDWLGTFSITPSNRGNASGQLNGILAPGGSNYCTAGTGGWEAHVAPSPNSGAPLQIAIISLGNTVGASINTSIALATNQSFGTNITTRAPAAALVQPAGFAAGHQNGFFCKAADVNVPTNTTCAVTGTTTHCEQQMNTSNTAFMQTNCVWSGGACTAATQNVYFCY